MLTYSNDWYVYRQASCIAQHDGHWQVGGGLAPALGWLFGTGTGAGMGLLMVLGGLGGVLMLSIGYALPAVRHVEDILPDHDQLERVEKGAEADSPDALEPGLALAAGAESGE